MSSNGNNTVDIGGEQYRLTPVEQSSQEVFPDNLREILLGEISSVCFDRKVFLADPGKLADAILSSKEFSSFKDTFAGIPHLKEDTDKYFDAVWGFYDFVEDLIIESLEQVKESQEEVSSEDGAPNRSIWARLGVSIDITREEEEAIFSGDPVSKAWLINLIRSDRCRLNRNTLIPARPRPCRSCVQF